MWRDDQRTPVVSRRMVILQLRAAYQICLLPAEVAVNWSGALPPRCK